jgi:cytoskeletal protein CcmA (bactofilin family)
MFSSKNTKEPAKRPPTKQTIDTWIGPDTEVTGTFSIRAGLHIDGRIRGTISAEGDEPAAVTISETGSVFGDIHAPHIIVNGYVEGDLHVAGRIELAERARIKGDVYYEVLEMAAGAEVNGRLVREHGPQVRHLAGPEAEQASTEEPVEQVTAETSKA